MSLVDIVLTLIVIGFLLWLVRELVPMDPRIHKVIYGVVIFFIVLWLLRILGLLEPLNQIRIGK